jgi:molybdopterin-guanine dinucleotide biosynthesis protein A
MSLVHAVIIAGGEGQRLGGVRKADLRIGGVRQIDRVVAALGAVARPILVSTGPENRRVEMPAGCAALPDLDAPHGGPLAGLAAAIDRLAREGITRGLLVSVAVDTPFLPGNFVQRLEAALGAAPAAFAAWEEDFYPPNAIWRIESLQHLPASIVANAAPASLKALQRELGALRVDWTEDAEANPFLNINTVADLVTLQRIAKG